MTDIKRAEAAGMREEGYEHAVVSPASQLASKPDYSAQRICSVFSFRWKIL